MARKSVTRRRLLEISGVGTALAVSGCGYMAEENGAEPQNGSDEAAPVTVLAQLDQEEQQALEEEYQATQQEIIEAYEEGDIDEEEAQVQLAQAEDDIQQQQQDLITAAVESVQSKISNNDQLTVDDAEMGTGILLVDGEASALLSLLQHEQVTALLAGDEFERYRQQDG